MRQFFERYIKVLRIGYFFIASVFLMCAMTAYWVNTTFYDTDTFVSIADTALNKDSSRQAIASSVREKALKEYPKIDAVLGPKLEQLVVSALGTNTAKTAIHEAVEGLQIVLTTERRDPVEYDLKLLKVVVQKGQELLPAAEKLDFDTEKIPDSIVIFDTAKLPNVQRYGVWAVWLGPITALTSLLLYAYWVYRGGRKNLEKRVKIVLLAIVVTAVAALFVGPLVKPPLLSLAADAESQTLLRNVYEGFMAPFTTLALRIAVIGVVLWSVLSIYSWLYKNYSLKASIKITKKQHKGRA